MSMASEIMGPSMAIVTADGAGSVPPGTVA
jgi:hypothetical protein